MAVTQLVKTALPSAVAPKEVVSFNPQAPRPAAAAISRASTTIGALNTLSATTLYSSIRMRSVFTYAAAVDAPAADAPSSDVKDYGVQTVQGKRLQVISAPVAEDTITIRCLDWDRDRFDIEFG
jgi:hypothetical protein